MKTNEQGERAQSPRRDEPWMMRTYSGHSSAQASNELYRKNLEKGQTGLSIAFDLPTQIGYDADHPLAKGEVGKVGVPVAHLDDMDALLSGLPLETMNTSMTINATAMWLFSLYLALAERRGVPFSALRGTTQNDILKEYLSRGTYVFPPAPSLKLIADMIAFGLHHVPKWNPINICSYHLQEAGATPTQELAYALATAKTVLNAVRDSGQVKASDMPAVVGRLSFFVNAGIRFIEETCKLRAFGELWDDITLNQYGVTDPALRRFRYGVQVNSLGLTERQPENNVPRIVLELLAVVLSKNARARAVQLPAWNEALGLPRPWDQQWSLRTQQVLAYETDLLEYGDILDGSPVIEAKVRELMKGALAEMDRVQQSGGFLKAVENGTIKQALVQSHAEKLRAVERGERVVVGVNRFTETEENPLTMGRDGGILRVDPNVEREQVEALLAHRCRRNDEEVRTALQGLRDQAKAGDNLVMASIRCAHAGVTTGEWTEALRDVFGEYRAPTGVQDIRSTPDSDAALQSLRALVRRTSEELGRPLRVLVGKPGLDGHSNGAEQIAVKARDAGFEVVYEGIRLTPKRLALAALEEGVHLVGLSILSGGHLELVSAVMEELRNEGLEALPVVLGGIIPEADVPRLREMGVRAVYTPKDNDMNRIMADMVRLVRQAQGLADLSIEDAS